MNQLAGYTEIRFDGEILPFKFKTNAWALFCEKRNIEFGEIANTGIFGTWDGDKMTKGPDVIALLDLFYCAHVAACRSQDVKPKSKEFIIDMIDEVDGSFELLQTTMFRGKMLGIAISGEEDGGNPPTP